MNHIVLSHSHGISRFVDEFLNLPTNIYESWAFSHCYLRLPEGIPIIHCPSMLPRVTRASCHWGFRLATCIHLAGNGCEWPRCRAAKMEGSRGQKRYPWSTPNVIDGGRCQCPFRNDKNQNITDVSISGGFQWCSYRTLMAIEVPSLFGCSDDWHSAR